STLTRAGWSTTYRTMPTWAVRMATDEAGPCKTLARSTLAIQKSWATLRSGRPSRGDVEAASTTTGGSPWKAPLSTEMRPGTSRMSAPEGGSGILGWLKSSIAASSTIEWTVSKVRKVEASTAKDLFVWNGRLSPQIPPRHAVKMDWPRAEVWRPRAPSL